jgi:predicted nuclease with TOPRIM domain
MSESNIENIINELAEAKAEARRHRTNKIAAKKELEAIQAELAEAKKKLEAFEMEPNALKDELDKLKGEIRTRDHRTVFEKVAKGLKVREDALNALWKLSDYKAEADTPDEAAIASLIGATVEGNPYLLAPEEKVEAPKVLTPSPGLSRGTNDGTAFVVTKEQLRDVNWMMRNGAKVAEHRQAGDLLLAD